MKIVSHYIKNKTKHYDSNLGQDPQNVLEVISIINGHICLFLRDGLFLTKTKPPSLLNTEQDIGILRVLSSSYQISMKEPRKGETFF